MNLLQRLPRPGLRTRVALAGLLAFGLLVWAFEWNWFRPSLERYLSDRSGRSVQLADLHLGVDARFQPVVRLRGVKVQNAPWADTDAPFAVAGEAHFTFSWDSLFDDVRVVTQMVLIDADVNLQRQADGLRNWRLTRPDDRGPGRMRVLALEARRTRMSFVHHGVGLAVLAASTPLPKAEHHADGPLTHRIRFNGLYRGSAFQGDVLAGPVLSLQQTGDFFPLRGQAQTAQTVLRVDGRMADFLKLGAVAAQVQLSGPSLVQLRTFFPRQPWPASKPYRIKARVAMEGDTIDARDLQASLGGSDLAGSFGYDVKNERPVLQATLRSERVDLVDLPAMRRRAVPVEAAKSDRATGAQPTTAIPAPTPPTVRVLPQTALNLQALGSVDATVDLSVKALHLGPLPPLQAVRANAALDQGLLQISLASAQLAAGRLNGEFVVDTRPETPTARIDLRARRLRVEKLLPGMPQRARVEGPLSAQVKLSGHGRSVAAWLGSASGQANLQLDGGSVSSRLDAKLGLNAGKLLRSFFPGDGEVAVRCAALAIDFADGKGSTQQLVLDTAHTHVQGRGTLLLAEESWAALLTPSPHKRSLLALDASVQLRGTFRDADYELTQRERLPQRRAASNRGCGTACAPGSARCD